MRLESWETDKIDEFRERWKRINGESDLEDVYNELAHLLDTQQENAPPPDLFRHLEGETNRNSLYRQVSIPKRRGGKREISIPRDPLRWIQRSILQVFTHLFPRHDCAHGFERGRSTVTNALPHVGRSFVFCIDLKDFFPSITRNRVFGMLRSFPFEASERTARHLANLTTHLGRLPQGAPTSPIISNLLCRRFDSRMFKWARSNGYRYTRYADDLAFSTNRPDVPDKDIRTIKKIIRSEGFEPHPEKESLMPSHGRQMVTGLIVNEKLNVPREYHRGLRALLRNVIKFGWQSQVNRDPYFDSKEKWKEYISGELSAEELRKVQDEQSRNHSLLSPGASIALGSLTHLEEDDLSSGDKVERLKKVVEGRIEYLRHVRSANTDHDGWDDNLYRRLRRHFNFAYSYRDKVRGAPREYRRKIERVDNKFSKRSDKYQEVKRRINEASTPRQLIEIKDHLSTKILEFGWLRPANHQVGKMKNHMRHLAFKSLTSGKVTGGFFSFFREPDGFNKLLHPIAESDLTTRDVLARAEASFMALRNNIPNDLEALIEEFLNQCKEKAKEDPSWHPWSDREFRSKHALPFKKKTRFDSDPNEATDLLGVIENAAQEANQTRVEDRRPEVELILPRTCSRVFTCVKEVQVGIRYIVYSMVENSKTGKITVETPEPSSEENGLERVDLIIREKQGSIAKDPDLRTLFGHKLQQAVRSLRGYAGWELSATFQNGQSYRFDVMRNKRTSSEPLDKVMHRIVFYQ